MIFNLLQALGWMSVLVIYDDRHTNNTFWKELENLPSSMRLILINWNGTIEDALDRMESKEHNINIVLKCSLDCVESTLIQGEEYEKKEDSFTSFKHRSRWLIFTDQWQEVDIRNIKLDHVTFIDPYQNITLTNFLMINTLTWGPERQRYVTESGPDLENLTTSEMFPNIKYGLNKKHFRVVTKVWPPYVVDKTTDKNGKIVYEGLCADLVKVMADIMNFTYAFQLSPDNEWGRIVNGTWTGLIGSLQRREADLMASSIGISEDREKVMDFTFPYMFIHGVAMFKLRNNPYEEKWLTLLKPFSWRVLMCIGVSLVVAALLYHLIEISNPFYISPPTQTVWFRLEYLYGALLSHGCGQLPEALAGRVFVSWWWLFCMILAASYSGTLIATLTITKDQFPFTTLSEMIQQEQYKWGCLDKTLFIPLFSNSTNEVFSSIWDGIVEFNQTDPRVLSSTRNDHYNLVLDSDYVFLTDDANYACQGHNNCHLRLLKDEYFSLNFAFGLQNHSPYTGQFSLMALRLFESHHVDFLRNIWWGRKKCSERDLVVSKNIDLVSLQSVFYFLVMGVFLAALSLMFEVAAFLWKRQVKRNMNENVKSIK